MIGTWGFKSKKSQEHLFGKYNMKYNTTLFALFKSNNADKSYRAK